MQNETTSSDLSHGVGSVIAEVNVEPRHFDTTTNN